jgi:hypothetical protein
VAFVVALIGAGFIMLAYEFQRGSGDLSHCFSFEYTQAWQQIVGEREYAPCLAWNSMMVVDPLLLVFIGIMIITGSIIGALQAVRSLD